MSSSPKVAVVTGSNRGIGLGIVKALLSHPFNGVVYLTARDSVRGLEAVDELAKTGLQAKYHWLDIDSAESIQKFRDFIENEHGGLDVLINNAAIAFNNSSPEPFAQQAEDTIRVNFFGTLNVCRALFPLLRPHGRVVHMSSSLGHLTKIQGRFPESLELCKQLASPELTEDQLCDLMESFVKLAKEGSHTEAGWPNSSYTVSKVGVSALTRIQQRELDVNNADNDIIVNSVHPGYVATELNGFTGTLSVEQGAEAPTWLALLPPNVNGNDAAGVVANLPRGQFVWYTKEIVDWVDGPTPTPY